MALTTTTLSAPCGLNDRNIVVVSATGFAAGNFVDIDGEGMTVTKEYVSGLTINVLRGIDGTQQLAHPTGANVTTGLPTDFPADGPGGPSNLKSTQPANVKRSYSAAGAIELPKAGQNMLAILNGTVSLAMSVAAPTKDMDGCRLVITNGGKVAHVVTVTGGIGGIGGAGDIFTFKADQTGALEFIAINGAWNLFGAAAGAATILGPGLA